MNKSIASLLFLLVFWSNCLRAQHGLKAEYYNGIEFDKKVATRIDDKIDFFWLDKPPVRGLDPNYCSVRWTGRLFAPETGTYTFSARVDDGIRVWVGGVMVINNWNLNDVGIFSGQVKMEAGKQYDLKVEFFNALVEAEITLLWELPSEEASFPGLFGRNFKVVEPEYFLQAPEQKPPPPKPAPKVEVAESATENKMPAPPPTSPKPKPKKQQDAPPPATNPAAKTVVHKDTIERYTPKNVNFERGKSIMLAASHRELDNLAAFLLRNPDIRLKVEGHTDVIGDPDKNWELSEERAEAVAAYLVQKGIEAERIQAKGYGSSKPLVKGDPKKHYPVNRRVEFIFY